MSTSNFARFWLFVLVAVQVVCKAAVLKYTFEFTNDGRASYLLLKILDEYIFHAEYGLVDSNGNIPVDDIFASPMVFKQDSEFPGPKSASFEKNGNVIETSEMKLEINVNDGCVSLFDKRRTTGSLYVSTVCPKALYEDSKGFSCNKEKIKAVYGIAQYFNKNAVGSSDGDFISHGSFTTEGPYGNHFAGFPGDDSGAWGANSQIQFPVMHALGDNENFALFLDNVYKQNWDFSASWIEARMFGDVRFYVMLGENMIDVRQKYMDLVGKPPVPRKKALGLWISEFGFENWGEIDWKLWGDKDGKPGLRKAGFPVDGIVLDLQWYGGVIQNSPDTRMGSLEFDENNFPQPDENIARYKQANLELVAIEQSYTGQNRYSYQQLNQRGNGDYSDAGYLINQCGTDIPIEFSAWLGKVGAIDWSEYGAGEWFHNIKRKPNLIDKGIYGHWTDLGEPERYNDNACYKGVEPGRFRQGDIHNIYNFLWHQSIYEGYFRDRLQQRPFLLARAGAPGIHRFGAAMWSGDITGRLEAYSNHMNAQMHMAFNGIDYYGSDIGGFWRRSLFNQFEPGTGDRARTNGAPISEDDLYTQWFAGSAWTDIPVRPHGYNCGFDNSFLVDPGCPYEYSPAWIGHIDSNRFAIHQRYELTPYYYSLAHEAFNTGYPVISPPIMHFEKDENVRSMGHQKMIGPFMMIALVASHGQQDREVYLPAGKWINYHTNEKVTSNGEYTGKISLWGTGKFTLPAFVRAGSILPTMYVDTETEDVFGNRANGKISTLILKLYSDTVESSFTLYEDDGETITSWNTETKVPTYSRRKTTIHQSQTNEAINITVAASIGSFTGAPSSRSMEIRAVSFSEVVVNSVTLNGDIIEHINSEEMYDSVEKGWMRANSVIKIKTPEMDTDITKSVIITLGSTPPSSSTPTPMPTSDNIKRTVVFIYGQTSPGQDMFVRGGLDHGYAESQLGYQCSGVASESQCAIPIVHRSTKNGYTAAWKAGDNYLDWYGAEDNQCNGCAPTPEGSPLEWTTNNLNPNTVEANGFGYTPLNVYGDHMWLLDVDMDCSRTVNGWFELKSYISNGPEWESDVQQQGTPWNSNNHFGVCGKINVFYRGSSEAQIYDFGSSSNAASGGFENSGDSKPTSAVAGTVALVVVVIAAVAGTVTLIRRRKIKQLQAASVEFPSSTLSSQPPVQVDISAINPMARSF